VPAGDCEPVGVFFRSDQCGDQPISWLREDRVQAKYHVLGVVAGGGCGRRAAFFGRRSFKRRSHLGVALEESLGVDRSGAGDSGLGAGGREDCQNNDSEGEVFHHILLSARGCRAGILP